MKKIVNEEVKAAQERADILNNAKLSEAAIKQQVNEIKKVGVESYLSYQENKFVVNDMVAKLQLYRQMAYCTREICKGIDYRANIQRTS